MKTNRTVAIIGECMIELSGQPFLPQQQRFGGDTLNTALYLSRLEPSLHPRYITGLGADTYSTLMKKAWEEEGINCQSVITIPEKLPGLYAIEIDPCGERSFIIGVMMRPHVILQQIAVLQHTSMHYLIIV
ncbi:2-dehydro-3-deoxygluconokinase [Proteus vulgaris]|nr:2-dehydro-3-deoxygluconokinase [Proteus vulgaris]